MPGKRLELMSDSGLEEEEEEDQQQVQATDVSQTN